MEAGVSGWPIRALSPYIHHWLCELWSGLLFQFIASFRSCAHFPELQEGSWYVENSIWWLFSPLQPDSPQNHSRLPCFCFVQRWESSHVAPSEPSRSSLLSLDIEIDAGGPLQFTKPFLAQTLARKLHAHVHAGGPPQDLHPREGRWVTGVPEASHTLILQVLLLSSNFALSSLGQKIYCISAFLSQEWIEFIPFSANNNRQSGNLVENK